MEIISINHKLESAYSWAVIPEDLPRSNLFFVTAKTASPSIHPEDKEDPIRQFAIPELHEAARSLGRRFINMNHAARINIETAFTVDSQFNPTTEAVEALIYVPDYVRDMINRGEIKKASVEYVWRDIRKTEVGGSEFVGIIFDKIALLEESWLQANGYNAGDSLSEIRKAEASGSDKRGFLDAKMEAIVEVPPEQAMKQDQITQGMKDPDQGFPVKEEHGKVVEPNTLSLSGSQECTVNDQIGGDEFDMLPEDVKLEAMKYVDAHKGEPFAGYKDFDACVAANKDKGNPKAYCGYIKHKTEANGSTSGNHQQKPEGTNVMPIAPEGPVLNQTPVSNEKPVTNVASAGMVTDATGAAYFGKVEEGNPHKNLDMPKAPSNVIPANNLAKEGTALSDSTPIATSNEINVIGMDESKQKVEAVAPPVEPAKPVVDPPKVDPPKADPLIAPVITPPVEDYKSKFEAVSKDLVKVKEHEAFLESACKKLSDNAKLTDNTTAEAVRKAKLEGKQEVLQKIKEVIPDDSQFGYNIQNSTRSLIYNIKKKCLEVSKEE